MSALDFIPRIEKEIQSHIDWAVEWSNYRLTRMRARELIWHYWIVDDRFRKSIFSKAYKEFLESRKDAAQKVEYENSTL